MTAAPAKDVQQPAAKWLLRLEERLRRVTTSQSFIPEIDGLRFIAIISVVLLHLGTALGDTSRISWIQPPAEDWLRRLTLPGGIGVYVFFAISGFILGRPFAAQYIKSEQPVLLGRYFLRRLTRLEPPYLVTMLIFYLAHVLVLGTGSFAELLPSLAASVVYLHCLLFGEWSPINPVTWSLETEVQFYILAPVFALLFGLRSKTWRRSALLLAIGSLLLLNAYCQPLLEAWHLDRSLLAFGQLFLVGFLFADFYLVDLPKLPRHSAWDPIGLAALFGTFYLPQVPAYSPLFCMCIFLLFVSVFRGPWLQAVFTNKWITVIGGMCYTIYLIHYAFIVMVLKITARFAVTDAFWVNYLLQAVLVLPLLLLGSALFFAVLERPCMDPRWPAQLLARLKGRRQAQASR